jgi:hypothetical protein
MLRLYRVNWIEHHHGYSIPKCEWFSNKQRAFSFANQVNGSISRKMMVVAKCIHSPLNPEEMPQEYWEKLKYEK